MDTMEMKTHVLAAALAVGLIGVSQAFAQVSCGDVITTNVTLTGDLDCNTDPALQLVGPAKLDLNGHDVSCTAGGDGIVVEGRGAKLTNGRVFNCNENVILAGEGRHKVENVTADMSIGDSFKVRSDSNKLKNNAAYEAGDDGFEIKGSHNKLKGNESIGNNDDGFDVAVEALGTVLSRNSALQNVDDGFSINSPSNKVKKNLADSNIDDGIDLESGSNGNKIQGNTCTSNGEMGIEIEGGATGNLVKRNTASDNSESDLRDKHDNCDNNTWKQNTFGTSDPGCIQ